MDLGLDGTPGRQRQASMSLRTFEAIRARIVQLELRPGHLLSEAELARQLGVSRQPVREAFIKLAEAGLVEVRPQRGTFVKLISIREVYNARFIREAIELAVVREAASRVTPDWITGLRGNLEQQRQALRADPAEFLLLDEAFHSAIARSAGCEHAWRVVESLKTQMDRVRYLSMPNATPTETLVAQHTAIVDALEHHAPDAAEKAMRAHLSEILTSLPRLAEAHPELFAE